MWWCIIGKPATGNNGFGVSRERGRNLVPRSEKRIILHAAELDHCQREAMHMKPL